MGLLNNLFYLGKEAVSGIYNLGNLMLSEVSKPDYFKNAGEKVSSAVNTLKQYFLDIGKALEDTINHNESLEDAVKKE